MIETKLAEILQRAAEAKARGDKEVMLSSEEIQYLIDLLLAESEKRKR